MMNEHTTKAFDADLQEIARMVAEMGGLAEKQVADSVDALAKRDVEGARRVVAVDASADGLTVEPLPTVVLPLANHLP